MNSANMNRVITYCNCAIHEELPSFEDRLRLEGAMNAVLEAYDDEGFRWGDYLDELYDHWNHGVDLTRPVHHALTALIYMVDV